MFIKVKGVVIAAMSWKDKKDGSEKSMNTLLVRNLRGELEPVKVYGVMRYPIGAEIEVQADTFGIDSVNEVSAAQLEASKRNETVNVSLSPALAAAGKK